MKSEFPSGIFQLGPSCSKVGQHYPPDKSVSKRMSVRETKLCYPVDSDLSGGQRYPPFQQLGPGKQECLCRRSVCFRNFPLKRRKQPETELMVSLANHRSVLLVCVNGSYIKSCSSFMIHTRCHTSIQAPLWHPRSFFFSFESPQG